MIAAVFIAAGYVLLVVQFGWPGVLVALAHAAIMLAATWRR